MMTNAGDILMRGTRLDEFEIKEVLGAGGFGVTYLAWDVSLAAWRAVKEYLPRDWGVRRGDGTVGPRTGADAEDYRWGLERFLEEARILARFDRRNLLRVYRVFEARGTAYMVTEYVEGRTLAAGAGPLPEARVREVLAALADGLTAVHAAGLLHRDIKPENVMVRANGMPVLIDFGSARQAMGRHSRSVTAVLTPGYAPIEQYSPRGHQGPWTDIYALGALAYWALSGEVPEDAVDRVEEDRVRPVAQVARGRVSESLAEAVDTALALYRADRPQSLEEWRAMLDRPPVKVSEEPAREPLKPPAGRRRLVVVGAVVAVAALGVALTAWRVGSVPKKNPEPDVIVADAPAAGTNGEAVAASGGVGGEEGIGSEAEIGSSVPTDEREVPDANEAIAAGLGLDRAARRAIQEGLAAAGFDPGGADGVFGAGTRSALRAWQAQQGIAGTGYLTATSAAELRAAGEAVLAARATEAEPAEASSVLEGGALMVVETTPPGAEVLVDGTLVGETPLERSDIRAGVREVTLRHPHYETVRIPDRNFEDGVVLRVEQLLERGVGRLTVTSTPRGAWVEVDGNRLAEGTPVTLENLPAGPVEVRLGALEHRSVEVEVEIPKDGVERLERTLARIPYGSLTLELEPPAARVTLPDGELRYRPGVRLPEGAHRVVVRHDGYVDAERTVSVSGSTRVRIALERRPLRAGESREFDGMEFAWVPAGEFVMGSTSSEAEDDESPVTRVRISRGYWLGKHEVTQAEWQAVTGTNPAHFSGCGSCPVENVSWDDAQGFIRSLNGRAGGSRYRLPTEAEWEYAARAGTAGDRYGNVDAIAWYDGNSGDRTHPVGQKAPNAWGLHDMLGNVWELVQDWYGDYPGGAVTDPGGPGSGSYRLGRGGSWFYDARICRASNRGNNPPGYGNPHLGFRLLRTE